VAFGDAQTFYFLLGEAAGARLWQAVAQGDGKAGMVFVDFARRARLRSVLCQFDGVPLVIEDLRKKIPDAEFVVNHQDVGHMQCLFSVSF
jgi:hypothetical protein